MLVKLLALAALAASASAATAPVYAGCLSSTLGLPSGGDAVSRSVASKPQCNAVCAGYTYSYYMEVGSLCWCSNKGPTGFYGLAQNSQGDCVASNIRVEKLATSYIFQECANTMTFWDPPIETAVTDLYQCFTFCNANSNKQFWLFAIFWPGGKPGGGFSPPWCQCSTSTSYDKVPCSPTNAYNYNLERIASASWVVRRQDKRHREGSVLGLCPGTKDACLVDEGSLGFECLDTATELESCGGCRYGALGVNNTATGEDCTLAPGTVAGATSCIKGECVSYACVPGWTLIDGRCWEV